MRSADIQPIALECHPILISNLNLIVFFLTERGKRDLENKIVDRDMKLKKRHSKCNRLYLGVTQIDWGAIYSRIKISN